MMAVWEYCQRGSLQDVLYCDNVKLDKMFIASFVSDIIKVSRLHLPGTVVGDQSR